MKTSLDLIRKGLAATVCLSVLAACDGRGSASFKAHRYTPEEYAQHRKDAEAANGKGLEGGNILRNGGGEGSGSAAIVTSGDVDDSAYVMDPSKPDRKGNVDPGNARSKFFWEFNEREDDQKKVSSSHALDTIINSNGNAIDAKLALVLSELGYKVELAKRPYKLSIRARVLTDKGPRLLVVDGQSVDVPKQGEVVPLRGQLVDESDAKAAPEKLGKSIYTFAYCGSPDTTNNKICSSLKVVIEFAIGKNERIYGVLTVLPKADGTWTVGLTNIETVKELDREGGAPASERTEGSAHAGTLAKGTPDTTNRASSTPAATTPDANASKADQPKVDAAKTEANAPKTGAVAGGVSAPAASAETAAPKSATTEGAGAATPQRQVTPEKRSENGNVAEPVVGGKANAQNDLREVAPSSMHSVEEIAALRGKGIPKTNLFEVASEQAQEAVGAPSPTASTPQAKAPPVVDLSNSQRNLDVGAAMRAQAPASPLSEFASVPKSAGSVLAQNVVKQGQQLAADQRTRVAAEARAQAAEAHAQAQWRATQQAQAAQAKAAPAATSAAAPAPQERAKIGSGRLALRDLVQRQKAAPAVSTATPNSVTPPAAAPAPTLPNVQKNSQGRRTGEPAKVRRDARYSNVIGT